MEQPPIIAENEVATVLCSFIQSHGDHVMHTDFTKGSWAVAGFCPLCNEGMSYQVDNVERMKALGMRQSEQAS